MNKKNIKKIIKDMNGSRVEAKKDRKDLSIREILEQEYFNVSNELATELTFRKEHQRRNMTETEYTCRYGFMQGIMYAKKTLTRAGHI